MIKRRERVEIVDFSDDEFRDDDVRYCPHCLEYGFKEKLGPRIYPANEPKPNDWENWTMCESCGSLYAVYELEKDSQIKNVVETIESPFELGSEFLPVDSRKSRNKKRKEQEHDDLDVNRELRKGHTLLSYTES